MGSDVNVAGAIGALNEAVGQYKFDGALLKVDVAGELAALRQMNSVLGVLDLQREGKASVADVDVKMIEGKIADRNAARKSKDFQRADQLRDELLAMGIEIKDGGGGTTWAKVVK